MTWTYHGDGAPAGSDNPIVNGNLTVTGDEAVGGNETVAGTLGVTGQINGSTLALTSSIKERGRTVAAGEWQPFTPVVAAATGTISGSSPQNARYSLVGKTLTISFYAASIYTLSGGASATLNFTIPGGFTCAARTSGMMSAAGGSSTTGSWEAMSGGTTVILYSAAFLGGSWANGPVSFVGIFTIEIQ